MPTREPTITSRRTVRFLQVLLALLLARQVWLAFFGMFNVDEFENLQIIWLWTQGVLPFRDYYHPHLPFYNLLLAPLLAATGPTPALLSWVRAVFFPVVLFTIWQVWWIARRMNGRTVGLLALVLFLISPMMAVALAEMRPDVLALPLVLGAVMAYLAQLDRPAVSPRLFLLAGLLLGLSFLFTQKNVFLALVLFWAFERHHARTGGHGGARHVAVVAGAAVLAAAPVLLSIVALFAAGVMNADQWVLLSGNGTAYVEVRKMLPYKGLICLRYAFAGVVVIGLSLLVGRRQPPGRVPWIGFAAAFLAVTAAQLFGQSIVFYHMFLLPHLFLAMLAARTLSRYSTGAIVALVIVQALVSHVVERDSYRPRGPQLAAYRYVLNHVDPDRPVLDNLTGFSTFRPIAGHFMFVRPMFRPAGIIGDQLVVAAKEIASRHYGAVVTDSLFRLYPEALRNLIELNYQRSGRYPEVLLPRPTGSRGVPRRTHWPMNHEN